MDAITKYNGALRSAYQNLRDLNTRHIEGGFDEEQKKRIAGILEAATGVVEETDEFIRSVLHEVKPKANEESTA